MSGLVRPITRALLRSARPRPAILARRTPLALRSLSTAAPKEEKSSTGVEAHPHYKTAIGNGGKPGFIQLGKKFLAQVYIVSSDEGGRYEPFQFEEYKPQVFFGPDVGVLSSTWVPAHELEPHESLVQPGDYCEAIFTLPEATLLDKGMRFSLREHGKLVGKAVVIDIFG
ncbi:hypothetical protein DL96DRAFT_1575631 [Flagelloscypha sp. PMI_526]|nr:hypothetical protein DL96DRAFT_1575631 [Flagelloscypha sp. PMI_526]